MAGSYKMDEDDKKFVNQLQEKDLYFVAVKLLLEKDGKLLITKDKWDCWDLPGGRIKKDEFETPLDDVIARKMEEELGSDVQYKVGKPVVFFRHERQEHRSENFETVRIFGVGYEAEYLGGEPTLGDHHVQMEWVDIKTFKPEDYFDGGWLKGVQEYQEIKRSS